MKKYSILIAIAITILSCKKQESIEYQFTDSPETIKCEGLDYNLSHEAYYSFRQDIAIYLKELHIGYDYLNYKESLGYYIYRGAQGNFDYREIASPHTIKLLKLLKENTDIWDTTSPKSKINYHSEFISCLVQNIKNEEIKQTIISLIESSSMNPSIFAENYRANVFDSYSDNHFGMLIAFDTYYQYLYDMDFNK
tara:strand:+ start:2588 stop:3172 length:585 start_codon:yes stop_codon:yes gene_type:complete